ncbi:MAG: NUDIX hydrolase [Myxococcales bacterium]|nr:NUDIX hydrolase [Myxococcales bacterium]
MSASTPRNPFPTVDIIIEDSAGRIVLIARKNEPKGWALPGGFVDYGESMEDAARREAMEETGLAVHLTTLLGVYSDPDRDPRHHTLSAVYIAQSEGEPVAMDDAERAKRFTLDELPPDLCFDHGRILADYRRFLETGALPEPS